MFCWINELTSFSGSFNVLHACSVQCAGEGAQAWKYDYNHVMNLHSKYFTWSSAEWPHTCPFWELVLELCFISSSAICKFRQQLQNLEEQQLQISQVIWEWWGHSTADRVHQHQEEGEVSSLQNLEERWETLCLKRVTTCLNEWKLEEE